MRPKPVNLNLFTIKFPLPAIVSILHRISGIILFVLIPCVLAWLNNVRSFTGDSAESHNKIINSMLMQIIIWFGLSALIYHLLAGLRHLLSDMGMGESLRAARASAVLVMSITIVISALIGIRLW